MKRREFIEVNFGIGFAALVAGVDSKAALDSGQVDLGKGNPDLSVAFWKQSRDSQDLASLFEAVEVSETIPQTIRVSEQDNSLKSGCTLVEVNQLEKTEPRISKGKLQVTLQTMEPSSKEWSDSGIEDFTVFARTVPPHLDADIPAVILWHFSNKGVLNAGCPNQFTVQIQDEFGLFLETSFDPKGNERWPLYFNTQVGQAGIPLQRGIYFVGFFDPDTRKLPDWKQPWSKRLR